MQHIIPQFLQNNTHLHEIEVGNQVQGMLNQGLIRENNLPYNSPTWVVPKNRMLLA